MTPQHEAHVAALFVQPRGCYANLPGVDPWDEARDARNYAGPFPVVAHPPCSRWCQLAAVNEKRYGHKRGDDGGCFASALDSVRQFGGVLEHPSATLAWPAHDLPTPPARGWSRTMCGGWVCEVSQRNYGHPARKATWLYAHGVELPDLIWGHGPEPEAWCSQSTNHGTTGKRRHHYAHGTPSPHDSPAARAGGWLQGEAATRRYAAVRVSCEGRCCEGARPHRGGIACEGMREHVRVLGPRGYGAQYRRRRHRAG